MSHSASIPDIRIPRIATTAVFFINGMALALFFANISLIKDALQLSDSSLGSALGLQGLGTVVFVVIGSLVAIRLGTRATMLIGACFMSAALTAIGSAGSFYPFLLAVLALGAANSFVDVSMNTHASLVEREYSREIMPTFHAAYNFGGFAGAAIASVLIRMTETAMTSLLLAGVAMVAILVVGWTFLGDLRPSKSVSEERPLFPSLRKIGGNSTLLLLGSLIAVALFVENAMNGWSGVYLNNVVGQDAARAADAFAAFQIALAIGRLGGSWALARLGARRVIIFGGLLASAGVVLVVTVISHWAALIGFAAIGLGLANCTPMFFTRAAAAIPSAPAVGIALANVIGYLGYIAGPVVLGLLSEVSDLKTAFLAVLAAMLLIALGSKSVMKIRCSADLAAN
ncbi:MFS transporter [Yangia mangrovi]|uniref:MFS transporter n=1 Tax=Alloyangia mangrovi TaxID=1779329 RepID=A0A2A3K006_9RHOB|nr:MFS transporter [Alloyangia mangrovi]MCT4371626.1 MFS transporter [Alloyangia mangrovi]